LRSFAAEIQNEEQDHSANGKDGQGAKNEWKAGLVQAALSKKNSW